MTTYEMAYTMPTSTLNKPQLTPRNYRSFDVRSLSGALGAEITGLDVKCVSDDAFGELHQALLDHQVLTLPDQTIGPADQIEFARRFGEPMNYDFAAPVESHPLVTELYSRPDDRFNFGGGWHTDSMNFERPPKITMLHCKTAPAVGGDTSFANLYLVWESLSEGFRELLLPLRAVAATSMVYGSSFNVGSDDFNQSSGTPTQIRPEQEDEEFAHPVARVHPETGRVAMYSCAAYSARFEGMTQAESLPLLRQLWERAIQPEFTCRVSWKPGTLTLWDNRCCTHYAHNDYSGQTRVMHRVIVAGEVPVQASTMSGETAA